MPILEAYACECPVIASTTAASPETAGDAAILVDPSDEDAMVVALSRPLDPDFRPSLLEKGTRRVSEFSWHRTARETLKVYRAVESMK